MPEGTCTGARLRPPMKVILVALVLSLAAVGLAAEPASACTDPSVCSTLADVKCALQDPTDTYRIASYCLGWIP